MPWVKEEKCIGCQICVTECPVDAISMDKGIAIIDQNICTKCGICMEKCPQSAIRPNSENPHLRGPRGGNGGRGLGRKHRYNH
jgi:Fe-S-cluster-containing hydrogenase component 2